MSSVSIYFEDSYLGGSLKLYMTHLEFALVSPFVYLRLDKTE